MIPARDNPPLEEVARVEEWLDHIKEIVDRAPPLSGAQKDLLRRILRPVKEKK